MTINNYNFPFSVADTETGPILQWEGNNLEISFASYQSEECVILFGDVPHFEFLSEDELDSTTQNQNIEGQVLNYHRFVI